MASSSFSLAPGPGPLRPEIGELAPPLTPTPTAEPAAGESIALDTRGLSSAETEIPTLQLFKNLMGKDPRLAGFNPDDVTQVETDHVQEGDKKPVLDVRGKPVLGKDGQPLMESPMKVETWDRRGPDGKMVKCAKIPLRYTFTLKNKDGREVKVTLEQYQYTTIPVPVRGTPQDLINFQAKMKGTVIAVRSSLHFEPGKSTTKKVTSLLTQTKLTFSFKYEDTGSKFYGHHVFRDETRSESFRTITGVFLNRGGSAVSLGQMAVESKSGKPKMRMALLTPISCAEIDKAEEERARFEAGALKIAEERKAARDGAPPLPARPSSVFGLITPEWKTIAGTQDTQKLTSLLHDEMRKAEECLANIRTAELAASRGDKVTAGPHVIGKASAAMKEKVERDHIKEILEEKTKELAAAQEKGAGKNELAKLQAEVDRLEAIAEYAASPEKFHQKIEAMQTKLEELSEGKIATLRNREEIATLTRELHRLTSIETRQQKINEDIPKSASKVDREVQCLADNLEELNKALAAIDVLVYELGCSTDPTVQKELGALRQKLRDAKYEEFPQLVRGFVDTMEPDLHAARLALKSAALAQPTILEQFAGTRWLMERPPPTRLPPPVPAQGRTAVRPPVTRGDMRAEERKEPTRPSPPPPSTVRQKEKEKVQEPGVEEQQPGQPELPIEVEEEGRQPGEPEPEASPQIPPRDPAVSKRTTLAAAPREKQPPAKTTRFPSSPRPKPPVKERATTTGQPAPEFKGEEPEPEAPPPMPPQAPVSTMRSSGQPEQLKNVEEKAAQPEAPKPKEEEPQTKGGPPQKAASDTRPPPAESQEEPPPELETETETVGKAPDTEVTTKEPSILLKAIQAKKASLKSPPQPDKGEEQGTDLPEMVRTGVVSRRSVIETREEENEEPTLEDLVADEEKEKIQQQQKERVRTCDATLERSKPLKEALGGTRLTSVLRENPNERVEITKEDLKEYNELQNLLGPFTTKMKFSELSRTLFEYSDPRNAKKLQQLISLMEKLTQKKPSSFKTTLQGTAEKMRQAHPNECDKIMQGSDELKRRVGDASAQNVLETLETVKDEWVAVNDALLNEHPECLALFKERNALKNGHLTMGVLCELILDLTTPTGDVEKKQQQLKSLTTLLATLSEQKAQTSQKYGFARLLTVAHEKVTGQPKVTLPKAPVAAREDHLKEIRKKGEERAAKQKEQAEPATEDKPEKGTVTLTPDLKRKIDKAQEKAAEEEDEGKDWD